MTVHDPIKGAVQRDEFETREALGEFEGDEVLLVAELRKGTYPRLTAFAGGKMVEYSEDEIEDEYSGGATYTTSYESVENLERAFRQYRDKYDLNER